MRLCPEMADNESERLILAETGHLNALRRCSEPLLQRAWGRCSAVAPHG
jgi:hypothetical protein